MIDKIIECYKSSKYDFRKFAFENDPLNKYFDQWVDYYRMKWAIAKAVSANSILEIGVRYGYSAHAFLSALPDACYLGVDSDEARFGGEVGAVD